MYKVVIIWDELDANIYFFVVECPTEARYKQILEMDKAYINSDGPFPSLPTRKYEAMMKRLNDLIYDPNGNIKLPKLIEFPIEEVKAGASVIVCGILP